LPVSEPQKKAIRSYVNKGYSSTRIQKSLSERHMGLRRKVLLAEIRRVKGIPKKPDTVKYIPKKYVKARWKARAELERILDTKQVTVSGKHTWIDRNGKKHTDKVSETKRGKGKDLYNWVMKEMDSDYWDEKPSVHS
jgi:hypothetical protein